MRLDTNMTNKPQAIPCSEYAKQFLFAAHDPNTNTTLVPNCYKFINNQLFTKTSKQIHPNIRLILETIYQLNPKSIWEVGCGIGFNLYSLRLLFPDAILYGCDICEEELQVAKELYPKLNATLVTQNISFPEEHPYTDITFVLMHILDYDEYVLGLRKMFERTEKQVIIVENWCDRDYAADMLKVTTWDNTYLYTRLAPEVNRNQIIIASQVPLDYEPLTNYREQMYLPLVKEMKKGGDSSKYDMITYAIN
jgi:hypothetical protein